MAHYFMMRAVHSGDVVMVKRVVSPLYCVRVPQLRIRYNGKHGLMSFTVLGCGLSVGFTSLCLGLMLNCVLLLFFFCFFYHCNIFLLPISLFFSTIYIYFCMFWSSLYTSIFGISRQEARLWRMIASAGFKPCWLSITQVGRFSVSSRMPKPDHLDLFSVCSSWYQICCLFLRTTCACCSHERCKIENLVPLQVPSSCPRPHVSTSARWSPCFASLEFSGSCLTHSQNMSRRILIRLRMQMCWY